MKTTGATLGETLSNDLLQCSRCILFCVCLTVMTTRSIVEIFLQISSDSLAIETSLRDFTRPDLVGMLSLRSLQHNMSRNVIDSFFTRFTIDRWVSSFSPHMYHSCLGFFGKVKEISESMDFTFNEILLKQVGLVIDSLARTGLRRHCLRSSFFFSRLQSHFLAVNCGVFWWWHRHTLPTWGLGFAMCLVHHVLPTARGVSGWSPNQVPTPLDGAWLRWSDGNRYVTAAWP